MEEHLLGGSDLDDPPQVHHGDAIGDGPRQSEVVRDQTMIVRPQSIAQLHQQREDLPRDRRVEVGDGLVGHDELGLQARVRPR